MKPPKNKIEPGFFTFWGYLAYCAAVEAEVSFSEQGAARQPLLLDSHRWQGIFQNDYTAFAIGMTDSIAAAMLPKLPEWPLSHYEQE